MAGDPLVRKILLRLRETDAAGAQRAQHALEELLGEGGLADLTQHDLQTYLWFTLTDTDDDPLRTAAALSAFFELAELYRYASVAGSPQTGEILRIYAERGENAGARAASKAMDASGVRPPDLPDLEWGELMGAAEMDAYDRVAATLELALAAGELKPGGRGWRMTQQRLARQQLTMVQRDGPTLLERIRSERLDAWVDLGGHARRGLASAALPDLLTDPPLPRDIADRIAPMQWLLEVADGRGDDQAGVPLTVTGNLARPIVQEAAERFNWWDLPERSPRSESDVWHLVELRTLLQRAGAVRRAGRRLVTTTRGKALLGDAEAQWQFAMVRLIDSAEFEAAAQEAALMLLLQSEGMVEVRDLVREVADVVATSGWRDTGDGAPPDDRDVSRAVSSLIRRCHLWSLVDEGRGPGFSTRLRLSAVGRTGGYVALRSLALRPRMDTE